MIKNLCTLQTSMILGLLLVGSLSFSCKKDKKPVPPPANPTVTDIDGNVYQTVTIGTQTWTASNLKVTHFNDGSVIPLVTDASSWITNANDEARMCWYDNNLTNKNTFGGLYNLFAVHNELLAPPGWHVATKDDWLLLENYLGLTPGGKLKQTGTSSWNAPNTGASNQFGFTALACGLRDNVGVFDYSGQRAVFWGISTNIVADPGNRGSIVLTYDQDQLLNVGTFAGETDGLSVRLVKD